MFYEDFMLYYGVFLVAFGTLFFFARRLYLLDIIKNPQNYKSTQLRKDEKKTLTTKHFNKLTVAHVHLFNDDNETFISKKLKKRV